MAVGEPIVRAVAMPPHGRRRSPIGLVLLVAYCAEGVHLGIVCVDVRFVVAGVGCACGIAAIKKMFVAVIPAPTVLLVIFAATRSVGAVLYDHDRDGRERQCRLPDHVMSAPLGLPPPSREPVVDGVGSCAGTVRIDIARVTCVWAVVRARTVEDICVLDVWVDHMRPVRPLVLRYVPGQIRLIEGGSDSGVLRRWEP